MCLTGAFTSVQTQARANNGRGAIWCQWNWKVVIETRKMTWLVWGRGDRSFWRWPVRLPRVYPIDLPGCPPTRMPPLTTVKEKDLEKNITPGGQGPSGWPQERPLETLQRATSVQTGPISSCCASPQSGAVKAETAAKRAVKFQLKFPSSVRMTLLSIFIQRCAPQLWFCSRTAFFGSHEKRIPTHVHGCSHSRTPTLHGIMRALLNSHGTKNTHAGGNPPPFRSKGAALQRHPNNKPLSNSESSQTIYNRSIRGLFFSPDRLLCLGVETSERWRWLMAGSHTWKNGLYHGIKRTWGPTMKPMDRKWGRSQISDQFF